MFQCGGGTLVRERNERFLDIFWWPRGVVLSLAEMSAKICFLRLLKEECREGKGDVRGAFDSTRALTHLSEMHCFLRFYVV